MLTGDVTQTALAEGVVQRTLERFGRIDVLVNNLGDAITKPLVALPDGGSSEVMGAVPMPRRYLTVMNVMFGAASLPMITMGRA